MCISPRKIIMQNIKQKHFEGYWETLRWNDDFYILLAGINQAIDEWIFIRWG